MALSDDLLDLEALVADALFQREPIAGEPLGRLRQALGRAADEADVLERQLDRAGISIRRLSEALGSTADLLSPRPDRETIEAGIAAGKLVVLASHRSCTEGKVP